MRKIKFFLNPIKNIESWLNKISKQGYRLKSIKGFIYEFEETSGDYSYSAQYIGANSYKNNKEYVNMLQEENVKLIEPQ